MTNEPWCERIVEGLDSLQEDGFTVHTSWWEEENENGMLEPGIMVYWKDSGNFTIRINMGIEKAEKYCFYTIGCQGVGGLVPTSFGAPFTKEFTEENVVDWLIYNIKMAKRIVDDIKAH